MAMKTKSEVPRLAAASQCLLQPTAAGMVQDLPSPFYPSTSTGQALHLDLSYSPRCDGFAGIPLPVVPYTGNQHRSNIESLSCTTGSSHALRSFTARASTAVSNHYDLCAKET